MKDPTDHTKSLKKFQTIFETFEAGYREASTEDRKEVIEEILVEIHKANKGKLSEDDVVRAQIINFYTNNQQVFKEDTLASIKVGKQWTPRLVIDYLCHDEIEETVNATPETDTPRIALWSKAVTAKYNGLSDEEKTRYGVIAEKWKRDGPPLEVKRRAATKKTGKYIQSVLEQLERDLGIHAMVLVTYQDEGGDVKISDFETQGIPIGHRFEPSHHDEMKKIRKMWGSWATKTFAENPNQGGDGDPAKGTPPPDLTSPAQRFLQEGPDKLWELKPFPDAGNIRASDIGTALHTFTTQQWQLAGGSKRVSWKDVTKQNEWYVDKVFLIPGTILGSPARIPEVDVKAYWIHWYNLSKSGNTFTFRKTTPPKEKGDGAGEGETELEEEDVLVEEDLPKKSGEGENPVPLIPQQCGSDGEKITFLRTLIPDHKQYQAIINILAPMSAGDGPVDISPPVGCFSWDWSSAYSDQNLHVKKKGSDRTTALLGWLDEDPHLDDSEKLVNRATMLDICLGVGILLGDSQLVLFTEDDISGDLPEYIGASQWSITEHDKFHDYICKLHKALLKDVGSSSRKKQKARAVEQPRPKPTKAAPQPPQTNTGDGSVSDKNPESDHGAGVRKSTRNKREPEKYGSQDIAGVGKGKQKEHQGNNQGEAGKVKRSARK